MKKNFAELELAAIERRLKSGKPMTDGQRRFMQQYNSEKSAASDDMGIAASVSDLARRLNVTRQLIYSHRDKLRAPKDLSVAAWRSYLLNNGRGDTIDRLSTGRCSRVAIVLPDEIALAQFHAVSNALPCAIRIALASAGVAVPDGKVDRAIVEIWLLLAAAQQQCAERQELSGIFDHEDGADYPRAIVAICDGIEQQTKN